MERSLGKFNCHEEMRAATYRYWHARHDSEIFEATCEMSQQAHREH